MGVLRSALAFEGNFTQIPNAWARDRRLSRRARGLLLEVMSHRVGWHVSIRSLADAGPEGRDAVQTALTELVDAGYLRRAQNRASGGKFGEIEYELVEPAAVSWESGRGEEMPGQTVSGFTVSGSAVSGESAPKNTSPSEDHLSEGLLTPDGASGGGEDLFDAFWFAYPRKVGKDAARKAFSAAVRRAGYPAVLEGVQRFAADPNLPEKQFIPHPSTWLSRGSWEDEPLPPRAQGAAAVAAPVAGLTSDYDPADSWMAFNR